MINQKPSASSSSYAPLSQAEARTGAAGNGSAANGHPLAREGIAPFYAEEAGKLQALRGSLWSAFRAYPDSPLPAPVIELASVYSTTLQLELKLLGIRRYREAMPPRHSSVKQAVKPEPETRP